MNIKNKLDKETQNIFNGICHFTLFNVKEIDDEFFKKLINFIDLSNINDREFFNNERVKKFVNYERINKKQLIRLATRDPEILNKVNIEKFKFKIKELEYFFKMWPEYIDMFNFDLKKVTGEELLILLRINVKYATQIDFTRIYFNKYHLTELIKNYYHRDYVINKILDLNDVLDNFQIRHLILQTGNKHLEKLDIFKLNELDWYNILQNRPDLYSYCDMEIFEKNDCYLLTKLARFIPDVEILIEKNKDKISNLGWENLLKLDFERFYPYCCFDCLSTPTRNKFIHRLTPR
jgi:hypothetical protein